MGRLLNRAIVRLLPLTPGFLIWPVARRYIAGSTLADAMRTVRQLNDLGATTTVDILGEEVTDLEQSRDIARRYREVLRALRDEGLDGNISVKLSAFGIRVDPAVCRELVASVLAEARTLDTFVRLDMEDSSLTQTTLDLYREMQAEFGNTGVVLQARLHRNAEDARLLAEEGARVRLVKGIYLEPADIADQGFDEIRAAFVRDLETLLRGRGHVAIATHDGHLVQHARRLVRELDVPPERYEFQMLLGVREKLRDALIRDGLTVRIYVPYGAEWRAYSVRRMQENPELAGHVMSSMLPWKRSK